MWTTKHQEGRQDTGETDQGRDEQSQRREEKCEVRHIRKGSESTTGKTEEVKTNQKMEKGK